MLRVGYTAIPLVLGIDKFVNGLVYWPQYLADWIDDIAPGTAQQFMYFVGVVEIVAGVLVLLKPRYAAYVVAAGSRASSSTCSATGSGMTSPSAISA
jgi:uncharacterized membrane protein YphA (DoxX/SURF4 family)